MKNSSAPDGGCQIPHEILNRVSCKLGYKGSFRRLERVGMEIWKLLCDVQLLVVACPPTMRDIVLEDTPLVNLPDVARRASPQETTWNNGVLDLQQDGSRLLFRPALLGLRSKDVNRRHFGGSVIPDETVGVHRVVMAKPVVCHGAHN